MRLIPVRFWTKRCKGCADPSPHDSHLTWLGRIALHLATRKPRPGEYVDPQPDRVLR